MGSGYGNRRLGILVVLSDGRQAIDQDKGASENDEQIFHNILLLSRNHKK
jgi:hypothetical protein